MTARPFARLGPACGIVFALGLFLAGSTYTLRGVTLSAFVLFVPFLAYLCSVLQTAEGEGGWLAGTAFAGGIAWIALKLGSIAPEIAIHRQHLVSGTPLHDGLQGIADAATEVSLIPLAVMVAAIAAVALATRALPRWLGVGAAVTAAALVVNAMYNLYRHSGFVPALLLFVLWTLLAGVSLLRRSRSAPAASAVATPATVASSLN
jgi:hypothetical protein